MTVRLAFAFVLLLCVGGFGLASTINQFAIIAAVNAGCLQLNNSTLSGRVHSKLSSYTRNIGASILNNIEAVEVLSQKSGRELEAEIEPSQWRTLS